MHESITLELVMNAMADQDYVGFCITCGEQFDGIEPDAHEYECECCGQHTVYGAEELLVMGVV